MLFCPFQEREHKALLPSKEGPLVTPVASSQNWQSSSSKRSSKPSLPPPGRPISILEFSELSPTEQKQWLEGNPTYEDSKVSDGTHHCGIEEPQFPGFERANGTSGAPTGSLNRASSHQASRHTREKESVATGWTTKTSEDGEDTTSTCSSNTSCYWEESDYRLEPLSHSKQRSIFAPYWTRAGQKPLQLSSRYPASASIASTTKNRDKSHSPFSSPGSDKLSGCSSLHPHDTLALKRDLDQRPALGTAGDATQGSSNNLPILLCKRPPALSHSRRVRSASDIVSPASSILKKSDDSQFCRSRSSSCSVTFDTKIDVVLFKDPPSYQTLWWQRLVIAVMGDDSDTKHQCTIKK